MYIHERSEWPRFRWDQATLVDLLAEVRYRQGRLSGRMEGLGVQLCREAMLTTLTQDVIQANGIDRDPLDPMQVRSAVARRLGMDLGETTQINQNVEGILEVLLDATRNHAAPLTAERLFVWQTALFPVDGTGPLPSPVGGWRPANSGPTSVTPGPLPVDRTTAAAPGADRVEAEMNGFIAWYNAAPQTDLVVQSAVAYFWFVTIHPFADGNGRIAQALADLMLARAEQSAQRFYSLSAQIQHERNEYTAVLEKCQKGPLDITPWIEWYLHCLKHALAVSETTLEAVLSKARFWEAHVGQAFNDRQRSIVNRLLAGFAGKLTSSTWARLTQCSQDTALRDINDLLKYKLLAKDAAGGRSTSYRLRTPE